MTELGPLLREIEPASVIIAIATFRRPHDLQACLATIGELDDAGGAWARDVIVVDNDAGGSAESAARRAARLAGVRLTYEVEPEPGISAARNRCVALAEGKRFLAFIDDDERADPMWLATLLAVQQQYDADMVGGPVMPLFDAEPPKWVRDSGAFERTNPPTGEVSKTLGTGNLLIRVAIRDQLGRLFDPRYGLTGGGDRELCIRARLAGLRLVWAHEAKVSERVQPERMRPGWVLRRGFRVGTSSARMSLDLETDDRRALLARGLRRAGRQSLSAAHALWKRDWGEALHFGHRATVGLGLFAGAAGVSYEEYSRSRRKTS